jgi:hypothetical protein
MKHGSYGYKKGCRCFVCRQKHSEALKRYRDKKAKQEHPSMGKHLTLPDGCGSVELRVRTQYHALGLSGDEAKVLMDLGILQAKLIDSIPDSGKWHLLGSAQKSLLDINDRLMKLRTPKGLDDDEVGPISDGGLDAFLARLGSEPR